MTTYGYARVSTKEQTLQSQLDALSSVGCVKIYRDTAGGASRDRPQFNELLATVTAGDTIVVVSMDRFARTLKTLISEIEALHEKGVQFRSMREEINTSTPAGKLFFHVVGAMAEFERNRIRERTKAGLEAAAAQGRKGGRPKKINAVLRKKARKMIASGLNKEEAARALNVSRATLYRLLKDNKK